MCDIIFGGYFGHTLGKLTRLTKKSQNQCNSCLLIDIINNSMLKVKFIFVFKGIRTSSAFFSFSNWNSHSNLYVGWKCMRTLRVNNSGILSKTSIILKKKEGRKCFI